MKKQYCTTAFLFSVLVASACILATGTVFAGNTLAVRGTKITALVDVNTCSWSPTWCTDSGSTGVAASGNNSVVGIVVQVPTAGLAETAFSLGSISSPGGLPLAFVTTAVCAACFAEPQPGVYRLAVRPVGGNWASGSYAVLLTVATPGPDKKLVIPIDIP